MENVRLKLHFSVNDGADAVVGCGGGGSVSDECESNPDSDDHHLLLNNGGSSSIHYGSHRYYYSETVGVDIPRYVQGDRGTL